MGFIILNIENNHITPVTRKDTLSQAREVVSSYRIPLLIVNENAKEALFDIEDVRHMLEHYYKEFNIPGCQIDLYMETIFKDKYERVDK